MSIKKSAKASPPSKHIIHEADKDRRHRIVIITGGKPDPSAWFEQREVAHYRGYFACVDYTSPLPQGIWRCSLTAHERLGGRRLETSERIVEDFDEVLR